MCVCVLSYSDSNNLQIDLLYKILKFIFKIQVSNWFINARVRLWKPMVEEMYLEETMGKEQKGDDDHPQQDNNKNKNLRASINTKTASTSSNLQDYNYSPADQISIARSLSTSPLMGVHNNNNNSQLLDQSPSSLNLVGSKKQRTSSSEILHHHNSISPTPTSTSSILSMDMEYGSSQRQTNNKDNTYKYSLITVAANEASTAGFGTAYDNLRRFQASEDQFEPRFHGNNNNGSVSLTLGLPHDCDNNNLSLSGSTQQRSYLTSNSNHNNNIIPLGIRRMQEEIGRGSDEADQFCAVNDQQQSLQASQYSSAGGFGNMDMQNRKRFAAHQLLPDFVT